MQVPGSSLRQSFVSSGTVWVGIQLQPAVLPSMPIFGSYHVSGFAIKGHTIENDDLIVFHGEIDP